MDSGAEAGTVLGSALVTMVVKPNGEGDLLWLVVQDEEAEVGLVIGVAAVLNGRVFDSVTEVATAMWEVGDTGKLLV